MVVGDPGQIHLPLAARLSMVEGPVHETSLDASWTLRGIVSNERYLGRDEKFRTRRSPGKPRAGGRALRGTDPDPQDGRVVGLAARRATAALRNAVASHRDRNAVPARSRAASASLPGPRVRQTVRLPHLVRIRADRRRGGRRVAARLAGVAGVDLDRSRGRHPAGSKRRVPSFMRPRVDSLSTGVAARCRRHRHLRRRHAVRGRSTEALYRLRTLASATRIAHGSTRRRVRRVVRRMDEGGGPNKSQGGYKRVARTTNQGQCIADDIQR